jgi:pyruvate,water dikinase
MAYLTPDAKPEADKIMERPVKNLLKKFKNWIFPDRTADKEKVGRIFRFRYACFKDLLASNSELLNIITKFEERLNGKQVFGMSTIRAIATRAVFHTLRMVKSLDDLSGHKYPRLFEVVDKINSAIKEELGKRKELSVTDWVLSYSDVNKEMIDWVGGKNANLGELSTRAGVPVPEGFAITTRAYDFFLEQNALIDEINRRRRDLKPEDPKTIDIVSERIQRLIISAQVPEELATAIMEAYFRMADNIGHSKGKTEDSPRIALRSSAIGEDSELSFAGQYLSILNVAEDRIVETYKYILAGLYTPRAISYRLNKGMRDEDVSMSVACVEMVESVASGVMYSAHPVDLLNNNVVINAVWGLGPYAVDGIITPDTYLVTKAPPFDIVERRIAHKPVQLVAKPVGGLTEIAVDDDRQDAACLTSEQAAKLAHYAAELEEHYQYPQDIEWAVDPNGRILILQARPLHRTNLDEGDLQSIPIIEGYPVLVDGAARAFPGIGAGLAYRVNSDEDLLNFPEGAVLIAKHSTPQFVIAMPKAQAIVTDAGSITGHMASLAREFSVPTLLGAKTATSKIPHGAEITVDAYSGRVYQGKVPELISLKRSKESVIKDTPVYETMRRVADWIAPLHLVNPRAANFAPEYCKTLHDVMRLVHELSYREMFRTSDLLSDTQGAGALKLVAPIPLDLHVIDLGGGIAQASQLLARVRADQIASIPFQALLKGMLCEELRDHGPRPIDLGGFLSVMREQMLAPADMGDRFGDRSYAIISDKYLNFSSRIGYHYSVLDSYCGDTVNKNYITFSFKGGAADHVRRNRRARSIAAIFQALDFSVDVQEDRVDARFYKYERPVIEEKLDIMGRLLQFTRQMDMLMTSEASVEAIAKNFLSGNYRLDERFWRNVAPDQL